MKNTKLSNWLIAFLIGWSAIAQYRIDKRKQENAELKEMNMAQNRAIIENAQYTCLLCLAMRELQAPTNIYVGSPDKSLAYSNAMYLIYKLTDYK